MALKLKKTAPAQNDAPFDEGDTTTSANKSESSAPKKTAPAGKGLLSTSKFYKKVEQKEAEAEARKAEQDTLYSFSCPEGEERSITFLDGDIDEHGRLDVYGADIHRMKINGYWKTFLCTMDEEDVCPACNAGERPQLRGYLTIINHTPYTIQSGPRKGEVLKHEKQLFVAPVKTITMLTSMAKKRGGSLRGCRFDVQRTGDKEPGVGNVFDFQEKLSMEEVMKKYKLDAERVQPADYTKEVIYRDVDTLVKMGVGKLPSGPGLSNKKASKDVEDDL